MTWHSFCVILDERLEPFLSWLLFPKIMLRFRALVPLFLKRYCIYQFRIYQFISFFLLKSIVFITHVPVNPSLFVLSRHLVFLTTLGILMSHFVRKFRLQINQILISRKLKSFENNDIFYYLQLPKWIGKHGKAKWYRLT